MSPVLSSALLAVGDTQLLVWCGVGLVVIWGLFKMLKLVAKLLLKLIVVLLVAAAVLWAIWAVGG